MTSGQGFQKKISMSLSQGKQKFDDIFYSVSISIISSPHYAIAGSCSSWQNCKKISPLQQKRGSNSNPKEMFNRNFGHERSFCIDFSAGAHEPILIAGVVRCALYW